MWRPFIDVKSFFCLTTRNAFKTNYTLALSHRRRYELRKNWGAPEKEKAWTLVHHYISNMQGVKEFVWENDQGWKEREIIIKKTDQFVKIKVFSKIFASQIDGVWNESLYDELDFPKLRSSFDLAQEIAIVSRNRKSFDYSIYFSSKSKDRILQWKSSDVNHIFLRYFACWSSTPSITLFPCECQLLKFER